MIKRLCATLFFVVLIWIGIFFVLRDIGDGKFVAGSLETEKVIKVDK